MVDGKAGQEAASDDAGIGEYLSARGGPFYELQLRLGLLRENAFQSGRRAMLFVALAWGVPLMTLAGGLGGGPIETDDYLLSPAIWARFFIAVGLFVLMERQVEEQLRANLAQFARTPLLAPESFAPAAAAVNHTLKWRDARLAEAICLAIAVLLSLTSLTNVMNADASTWVVRVAADGKNLTAAGWWALLVSSPIFWFLLLRWLWRHLLWAMLLRRIARLELKLVATHLDGRGGLAFIGRYPNAYATFVFALSCVMAAAVAHELLQRDMSLTIYGSVMAVWAVIVLGLFAYPLLAFSKPLGELKNRTMLVCSAQGLRRARAVERGLLGRNICVPENSGKESADDIQDPLKAYEAAKKMSVFLVDRSSLLPLLGAALLPLVAAGATKYPYKEIFTIAKRLLLL